MEISLKDYVPFERISDEDLAKAKFFNRVRLAESGCWLWTGYRNSQGYGAVNEGGRTRGAHIWSHELFKGPVPNGLMVLHACDNPSCCNPAHLRTGTAKENTADCISRGRFKKSAGTFNSLAKLTDTDIVEIRNSTLSHRDLSLKYGIDRTNIHYICNGETWKHVPMPEIKSRKADGRAKLTPDQAISIRSAAQEISHGALASEYGVSVPLVCMIRKGRAWKNLAASIEDNVNGN
jgi:hypothetical protein